MKLKLNTNLALRIFVVAYIIAMVVFYLISCYSPPREQDINVTSNLHPIDTILPGPVTYREYNKAIGTSLVYSVNKNAMTYGGSGIQILFIGTTSGISCDTCSIKWFATQSFKDQIHKKYYLKLPYWKIKNTIGPYWYPDSVRFHTDHGQNYIRKVSTKVNSLKNSDLFHNRYLVDIPVKFNYDPENQYILIPVSKSTKNTMDIILSLSIIPLLAYFLYLLSCFLYFIIDLSKGLAFTDKNIFRLKIIASTLILLPVIMFLLNLSMKIIFYNYFTGDVIMNSEIWKDSWKLIGIGFIFLLLYRAFAQGKILKDEQDLTV